MTNSPAAWFRGLFETHLHVADLERAREFYGEVLGLELAHEDARRGCVFYWVGPNHRTMLGLWQSPPWSPSSVPVHRQHLAFEVASHDLIIAIDRVTRQGLTVRDFFDQVTNEPSVFAWIPAASIYFSDPDGHLLELIAKLEDAPAPELGVVSLSEWTKRFEN
jgi:lactoylglutathione lyase